MLAGNGETCNGMRRQVAGCETSMYRTQNMCELGTLLGMQWGTTGWQKRQLKIQPHKRKTATSQCAACDSFDFAIRRQVSMRIISQAEMGRYITTGNHAAAVGGRKDAPACNTITPPAQAPTHKPAAFSPCINILRGTRSRK